MISKHDILVGIIAFVFIAGSLIGAAYLCMWVQSVFGSGIALILAVILAICIAILGVAFIYKYIEE